jgi:hypothetical protein
MSLTYNKYCIIETPTVDTAFITTYNESSTNTFNYNGICKVYYSDIVSPDTNKGCSQFNTSDNPNNTTQIGNIPTTSTNKYIKINNLTVYDISKYISNKYNLLINDLQLVNECNNYASPNTNTIPSNCQNTFQGYTTNSTINKKKLPLYTIPVNGNQNKQLLQQINDLNNLISTFNSIIRFLQSTAPNDNSQEILQNYKKNMELRADLDKKLGEIYRYTDSKIVQSENYLDRTVYTNVLLTILATSLIYMIFIKL